MIASGINIGRKRGEFEQATKIMRSVEGGHRDPLSSGVCEISKLADLYGRAAAKFCSQNKNGRHANGVPDERWLQSNPADDAHAAGFTGRPLDPAISYVFLCETHDLTIRGGHVTLKHGNRMLAWCEPELFAALGEQYRLTIKYDHTEPSLGAALFNREVGSRNRHGFKLGQFLGVAEYAPDAPQIVTGCGMLTEEEERALTHKKRFDAQVRSEYRSIGVFGRRITKASTARDGRGNVVSITNFAPGGGFIPADRIDGTSLAVAGRSSDLTSAAAGPGVRKAQAVSPSPTEPAGRSPISIIDRAAARAARRAEATQDDLEAFERANSVPLLGR